MIKAIKISAVVIAGIIAIMTISANPFAFVVSAATSNQTGNMTTSTSNSTASVGGDNQGKMHLDVAISALQSGDKDGAMMHLQESQKNT